MWSREKIEEDYSKIKSEFQQKDNLLVIYKIANEIKEHKEILKEVFEFLILAFKDKVRNDGKTPLVFHSIYLTRLAYLCGERNLEALLTAALHDVLEDTEISEEMLREKNFLTGRENLIKNLKTLKEDKTLSREPNGESLPPRYIEHVKRLIHSLKEVVNTEILDRFSDLMNLEYIMKLPEKERDFRLKAKLIKVKSFVYSIIKDRNDFNSNYFNLFDSKVKSLETNRI